MHKVGIETGKVITAAVGAPSQQRFDYVALGPTVTRAEELRDSAPARKALERLDRSVLKELQSTAAMKPRSPSSRRSRRRVSLND